MSFHWLSNIWHTKKSEKPRAKELQHQNANLLNVQCGESFYERQYIETLKMFSITLLPLSNPSFIDYQKHEIQMNWNKKPLSQDPRIR